MGMNSLTCRRGMLETYRFVYDKTIFKFLEQTEAGETSEGVESPASGG
jgi:hypothetical protein